MKCSWWYKGDDDVCVCVSECAAAWCSTLLCYRSCSLRCCVPGRPYLKLTLVSRELTGTLSLSTPHERITPRLTGFFWCGNGDKNNQSESCLLLWSQIHNLPYFSWNREKAENWGQNESIIFIVSNNGIKSSCYDNKLITLVEWRCFVESYQDQSSSDYFSKQALLFLQSCS